MANLLKDKTIIYYKDKILDTCTEDDGITEVKGKFINYCGFHVTLMKFSKVLFLQVEKQSESVHENAVLITYEPQHDISNNVVCATSKASDQPAHTRSLIRIFASRLNILQMFSYRLNIIWSF